ncbi:MAG: anaerobic C4-dicarboxylate transporter [Thermodesulfobacteriota bacterium]
MGGETIAMILQGLIVLGCISLGVRTGGMAVGLWGGAGVLMLVTIFKVQPGLIPTSAIFIIFTVVTAAGAMQVAGGIDYLVAIAQRMIRKKPRWITFIAPGVTWIFTLGAGTGNVYYSLLPVIEEVAYKNNVRPERPLAISPVASQIGITSSPVSAAMAAMVGLMAPLGFEIIDILMIVIPSSLIAIVAGSLVQNFRGKELKNDPVYQALVASGKIDDTKMSAVKEQEIKPTAKRSAMIFLAGVIAIVLFGIFPEIRPHFIDADGKLETLSMTYLIMLTMFCSALAIVLTTDFKPSEIISSKIFTSGMVAVVALFGVAWMANTFIGAHKEAIIEGIGGLAQTTPLFLALALFIVAALTTSQSSTTLAIIPIGITLGIPAQYLIAMWPAVIGIYFFPANGGQIATVQMDRSGTTRIGKLVINHSFMIPMLVCAITAVGSGMVIATLIYGSH